VFAQVVIKG